MINEKIYKKFYIFNIMKIKIRATFFFAFKKQNLRKLQEVQRRVASKDLSERL